MNRNYRHIWWIEVLHSMIVIHGEIGTLRYILYSKTEAIKAYNAKCTQILGKK